MIFMAVCRQDFIVGHCGWKSELPKSFVNFISIVNKIHETVMAYMEMFIYSFRKLGFIAYPHDWKSEFSIRDKITSSMLDINKIYQIAHGTHKELLLKSI
jgi:hypothetical protein